MLTHLSIKNYALIKHTAIHFSDHLTIITGETGAGKSILLDALGLVLGKRADLSALKKSDEKCVIEAHFNIFSYQLENLFLQFDLDYEEETIIRREILPSGKSRAFVNDVPTTLQNVQKLGEVLIDIHTQHQTQDLFNEKYQLHLIDVYAGCTDLLKDYQLQLVQYKSQLQQLDQLREKRAHLVKEQDYNAFLLDELTTANLKAGEQEELESQYEVLANVEKVGGYLEQSFTLLRNDEFGVNKQLYEVKTHLQKLAQVSIKYEGLLQRLESSFIELEDVADEIQTEMQQLVVDPHQLELINQKLQLIYQLQKKHNVSTVPELLEIEQNLSDTVAGLDQLEEEIVSLEKSVAQSQKELHYLAEELHKKRSAILETLSNEISRLIKPLGMPNAQFNIELNFTESFQNSGKDTVNWLFSANKGMPFGLLKKTASGGELSRIMLAIKSILAAKSKLPTIIFDEIDTGVSGDVADKMGNIMREMGNYMQIFAITHLPQVAVKGKQHFKVSKFDDDQVTVSDIKLLNTEERINEIAQMLSGDVITEAALEQAKQLLN